MKGATGNLPLTLITIRDVLSDFEAREIRRNIELDRPQQGRALVAKQTGRDDRPKSPPLRDRTKRSDPPRHTPNKKSKVPVG
eukprot:1562924-Pleurochrysis_carterae.AAC.1